MIPLSTQHQGQQGQQHRPGASPQNRQGEAKQRTIHMQVPNPNQNNRIVQQRPQNVHFQRTGNEIPDPQERFKKFLSKISECFDQP